MKYLLYIDTSADTGMAGLSMDGKATGYRINEESRNHAATLNLMIDDLLREAEITLTDVSGIVVCAGPGSYTGLRIGMATAKGICYALDIPLILHNKLTLLAYHEWIKFQKMYENYISLLVARDREFFISMYDDNFNCTIAPQHVTDVDVLELIKKAEKNYIISDATEADINQLKVNNLGVSNNIKIDFNSWVSYTYEIKDCNGIVNLSIAEPFYLKQVYTHK